MDLPGEVVPFQLIMSGKNSINQEPAITVFRDSSGIMLVEVAGGQAGTGMAKLEVTTLRLYCGELTVYAVLRYPATGELATRDIAYPFVTLTTPVHEGVVSLDLSVIRDTESVVRHIKKVAPLAAP